MHDDANNGCEGAETINHADLPKKRGTVNLLKTSVYHKISSRSWSPFAVLFMATKMESQNKISVEMVSSTFKRRKPVPISYHQAKTVKSIRTRIDARGKNTGFKSRNIIYFQVQIQEQSLILLTGKRVKLCQLINLTLKSVRTC